MNLPPCLEEGCIKDVALKGRCWDHQRPAYSKNFRGDRLPRDWRQRREIVFARDKGICHVCKGPGADAIDHILVGDNHDLSNLAPIHENVEPFCHRFKTNQEANDAQRGAKTQQWGSSWAAIYQANKLREKNEE